MADAWWHVSKAVASTVKQILRCPPRETMTSEKTNRCNGILIKEGFVYQFPRVTKLFLV